MVGDYKMFRWRQRVAGATTLMMGLLLAQGAAASRTFPPILAKRLEMDCVPNCLPCHTSATGTSDNQRNDGIKLLIEEKAAGTVTSDEIFAAALDAVLKDAPTVDSDGDMVPDVTELAAGENPYDGPAICERPLYGCFASSVSPTLPTHLGALATALGVSGTLLLRRRRNSR